MATEDIDGKLEAFASEAENLNGSFMQEVNGRDNAGFTPILTTDDLQRIRAHVDGGSNFQVQMGTLMGICRHLSDDEPARGRAEDPESLANLLRMLEGAESVIQSSAPQASDQFVEVAKLFEPQIQNIDDAWRWINGKIQNGRDRLGSFYASFSR